MQRPFRALSLAMAIGALAACATPVAQAPAVSTPRAQAPAKRPPHVSYLTRESEVVVYEDQATVNLEFALRTEAVRALMATGGADLSAAVAPDIASVEFTITGPGLAQPLVAVVPRAKFLDGKAMVQFNNLPAGAITITAVAKDAAGKTIVEANGSGDVRVGELTKVRLACVVPADPGVGHVRIEMDCFSGPCGPKPSASPTAFVPDPVTDVKFHSLGDPHEDGANAVKFENMAEGTYMAMRTLTDDFMLVKHQRKVLSGPNADKTFNDAVAIRSNGELFTYYLSGRRMRLDGQPLAIAAGLVHRSPQGAVITCVSVGGGKAVIDFVTPQGDTVRLEDQQTYMNLVGTLGAGRVVHEVRGGFGTFNNGAPEDGLLLRDGTRAASVEAFIADWMARPEEVLFDAPLQVDGGDDGPLIEVG